MYYDKAISLPSNLQDKTHHEDNHTKTKSHDSSQIKKLNNKENGTALSTDHPEVV